MSISSFQGFRGFLYDNYIGSESTDTPFYTVPPLAGCKLPAIFIFQGNDRPKLDAFHKYKSTEPEKASISFGLTKSEDPSG